MMILYFFLDLSYDGVNNVSTMRIDHETRSRKRSERRAFNIIHQSNHNDVEGVYYSTIKPIGGRNK